MSDTTKRQGAVSFLLEMLGGFIGSIFLVVLFFFMLCGVSEKRFRGERKELGKPVRTWVKVGIAVCVLLLGYHFLSVGGKPESEVHVTTAVEKSEQPEARRENAFCFTGPDGKRGTMVAMDDETVVLRTPEGKLASFPRSEVNTVAC
jgi:hypothetical protein